MRTWPGVARVMPLAPGVELQSPERGCHRGLAVRHELEAVRVAPALDGRGVAAERVGVEHESSGVQNSASRGLGREELAARSGPRRATGSPLSVADEPSSARSSMRGHPVVCAHGARLLQMSATSLRRICTPASIGACRPLRSPSSSPSARRWCSWRPRSPSPSSPPRLPPRSRRSRGERRLAPRRARTTGRVGRARSATTRSVDGSSRQLAERGVDTRWVRDRRGCARPASTSRTPAAASVLPRRLGGIATRPAFVDRLPLDGACGAAPQRHHRRRCRPRATPSSTPLIERVAADVRRCSAST